MFVLGAPMYQSGNFFSHGPSFRANPKSMIQRFDQLAVDFRNRTVRTPPPPLLFRN